MSLDTYGFITDCGKCIRYALDHMEHRPYTPEGHKEAEESFGDLWPKYKEEYEYWARWYSLKTMGDPIVRDTGGCI